MKRWILSFLFISILALSLSGCKTSPTNNGNDTPEEITVRYLNFKPEVATTFQQIAQAYERETGRKLIVETAANNTYEQTLTSKMATSDAPTIFHINGPRGYNNWKKYCADLTDTQLYKHLSDKSLALTSGDGVYGIPSVVEGYGIIYNEEITDRYFALDNRDTDYRSMADIQNFDSFKALVEDMQAHKDDLGIKGVFAVTSLKPGEDWRWQTHLANIPIYYEFHKNNVDLTSKDIGEIAFEYADQFKNIFDLYLQNSTISPKSLGTAIVDESMTEFALGECAMVQNGNWAWNQINSVNNNTVKADKIKYLPIYTGIDGEEKQGLCIGTETYLCINEKASDAEKRAADDFLNWLYSSETGKRFVIEELNFIAPFNTFGENEVPSDPLAQEILRYMNQENTFTIPWQFTIFPSQAFKEDFGAVLLQYAQGTKSWDDVKNTVISRWKSESDLL